MSGNFPDMLIGLWMEGKLVQNFIRNVKGTVVLMDEFQGRLNEREDTTPDHHGVGSNETVIFIVADMRASDLTSTKR